MNQQPQARALPSFSGLSLAVNDARDYENSRGSRNGSEVQQQQDNNNSSAASNSNNSVTTGISSKRGRHASPTSETPANGFDAGGRNLSGSGGGGGGVPSSSKASGATGALLLQDTLSPLLEEVDALFERSKDIVTSLKAPGGGNKPQEDDVSTYTCVAPYYAVYVDMFQR